MVEKWELSEVQGRGAMTYVDKAMCQHWSKAMRPGRVEEDKRERHNEPNNGARRLNGTAAPFSGLTQLLEARLLAGRVRADCSSGSITITPCHSHASWQQRAENSADAKRWRGASLSLSLTGENI